MHKAKSFGRKMSRFSILCGACCGILALFFGAILLQFVHLSAGARLELYKMILISAFYVFTQCINIVVVCGGFVAGGDNCWIGANVTICPGVTIGENTVIGAGSVVTKNIPANVVAVGNPCRVLREINEQDAVYYYKDRKFEDSGIYED